MSIQTGNSLDIVSSDKMTAPAPPPPATLPTVGAAALSRRQLIITESLALFDQASASEPTKAEEATQVSAAAPAAEVPVAEQANEEEAAVVDESHDDDAEKQDAPDTPEADTISAEGSEGSLEKTLSIEELKALKKMPTREGDSFFTKARRNLDSAFRTSEIESAVEKVFSAEIGQRIQKLQDLTDGPDGQRPIIDEINRKGGVGKSSDTTSGATILGHYSGQSIIVLDNNQTKGNTASRLGVSKTLTVRQAMTKWPKSDFTHDDIAAYYGHHPVYRNVRVIDSDNLGDGAGQPIDRMGFRNFVLRNSAECHTLIIDGGNDVNSVQAEIAAEVSTVFRFVAVPWVASATSDCKETMDYLRRFYPTKVKHSIISLMGCKEVDMDLEYWAKYFNHPIEQIVTGPYDSVFEPLTTIKPGSVERDIWVMDHTDFQKETLLACLDREIATFEQAAILSQLPKDEPPEWMSKEVKPETPIARLQAILAEAADLAGGDTDKVQSAVSQLAAGIDPARIHF